MKWREDALVRALLLLGIRPGRVALAILAGVGGIGSAIALAGVSAWLIARASQMPPVLHLTVAVVAVRAFGITRGVLRYIERLASHDVAFRAMAHLRENLYLKLAASRAERVVGLRRGDVLQRVGSDVDDVGDVVVRSIIPTGVAAVLGLGSAAFMFYFLPAAGTVLALCIAFAAVLGPALTLRSVRRAEELGAVARADIAALSLTATEAAPELRVTGGVEHLEVELGDAEARLTAELDAAARPAGWSAFILEAAMGLAVIGAIIFGAPAVAAGDLAAVELAVIVLTPLAAFEPIQALPGAATQWYRSRSAARRILALIGDPSTDAEDDRRPIGANPGGESGPPKSTHISASNLTTGWDPKNPASRALHLEISPGESIAITGPSGAGKTALLLTIAGLIPPLAGSVRVGGVNPGTFDSQTRQKVIALNLEDAHIFNTTVLENLRVARGTITPAEAHGALNRVGLGNWISGLPDGLDTILGSDAANISGGERRRLLIARTLLSEAKILLIDEPAEHLDPHSADELVRDLLAIARHDSMRSVIIVTHRHAPLANADRVIEIRAVAQSDRT